MNVIAQTSAHGKNGFVEIFTNLATDLKIILLDHQNNYVGELEWQNFCAALLIMLERPT